MKNNITQTLIFTFFILFLPIIALSQTNTSLLGDKLILKTDLQAAYNPLGLSLNMELDYRHVYSENKKYNIEDGYYQFGGGFKLTPAYNQLIVLVEWQPFIFFKIRSEYGFYTYFGSTGSLISFDSGGEKFGDDQLNDRSGDEKFGTGHRISLKPTFQAKFSIIYFENSSDFAFYFFNGDGPYFYEQEKDLLMKSGEFYINNSLKILLELWKGRRKGLLLFGPFLDYYYTKTNNYSRSMLGGILFWSPSKFIFSVDRARVYLLTGVYLNDRNRQNEVYIGGGFGFDLDFNV